MKHLYLLIALLLTITIARANKGNLTIVIDTFEPFRVSTSDQKYLSKTALPRWQGKRRFYYSPGEEFANILHSTTLSGFEATQLSTQITAVLRGENKITQTEPIVFANYAPTYGITFYTDGVVTKVITTDGQRIVQLLPYNNPNKTHEIYRDSKTNNLTAILSPHFHSIQATKPPKDALDIFITGHTHHQTRLLISADTTIDQVLAMAGGTAPFGSKRSLFIITLNDDQITREKLDLPLKQSNIRKIPLPPNESPTLKQLGIKSGDLLYFPVKQILGK